MDYLVENCVFKLKNLMGECYDLVTFSIDRKKDKKCSNALISIKGLLDASSYWVGGKAGAWSFLAEEVAAEVVS